MSDLRQASIVAKHAAFQIAAGWEGTSTVLRFCGKVPRGHAVLLIGNYAGGERAIFSALQQTIGKPQSPAVNGLFSKCVQLPDDDNSSSVNILGTIDRQVLNAILKRNDQWLWSDQEYIGLLVVLVLNLLCYLIFRRSLIRVTDIVHYYEHANFIYTIRDL